MGFFRNRGIAFKFTALSLGAVALTAVTIATSLILIGRKALSDLIYAQQSETARRIADRVSLHVENVRSVIAIAAAEPGLAVLPRSRQEESLRRLLRWQPTLKEALILNASGQEVAKLTSQGNRFVSNPQLISRKSRPEFAQAMAQRKVVVGDPFFSADRLPYMLVSGPTYGRKAVLAAKVTLANLWDLVKGVQGHGGAAYIVDQKGDLIAHPDPAQVQAHISLIDLPIVRAFREGRTGRASFGVYRNGRRERVVSVVQEIAGLGWGVVVEVPTAIAYAPIQDMQKEVIRWTLVCVLVILALALWRVRQIVKPVRALEEGANKISQGQLDFKMEVRTGDELERLALAFQGMAASLKALEDLRRDLIAMIVHDLKSPLSAIMGALDYLSEQPDLPQTESTRKILSLAKNSSEDLLVLIQNLLDVARMEEGRLQPQRERAPLVPVFDAAIDSVRMQAEREGKLLVKDYPPRLPEAAIDVQLVRRVLNNLLSNAVRHTSARGRIQLSARALEDGLEIAVSDDGEGISPEYRERIFDKFVQAERKRAHVRSGTGLGLTFCKMAIELQGGAIWVQSELGKGSTFKFTLPLDPVPGAAAAEAGG